MSSIFMITLVYFTIPSWGQVRDYTIPSWGQVRDYTIPSWGQVRDCITPIICFLLDDEDQKLCNQSLVN